jgi:potassium efflux system protein
LKDLDKLLNGLVELQARERVLLQDVQDMDRYLRSREPWVRNGRRVTLADLPAALVGLAALPKPQLWAGSATAVAADVAKRPQRVLCTAVGVIAAFSVLLALRRRQGRIAAQGTAATQRVRPTIVLAAALLNGLAWLSISAAVGWWLAGVPDSPVASQALGRGLLQVTPGLFMAGFMHALFSRSGGAGGFNPALASMASRFRPIVWYLVLLLGVLVVSRVLWAAGAAGFVEHGEIGARLSLLIAALLMAVGIRRARSQRPRKSMIAARRSGSWAAPALYALAVTIPLVFVALLVQGFTIAAYDIARALIGTLLVLIVAGTVRVLFLAPGSTVEAGSTEWSSLRESRLDLLHVTVTLAVIACLAWIWRDVFTDLLYLQNVPLWTAETAEGLKTVTVANLLSCLAVLAGTLIAFWALPLIVATEATDSTQRSVGTRYAVVALVRYTVLIVGLAAAFSLLNIGWSKLQWMAAGLSVGLGFGLQETAANLFSGLTLLSERSIRVGDLVTVGDKTGIVRRIKVRATTVEDFDGREIVIPNKELVATQVTNWTLTDAKRRLQIVVGVAYGSDTTLVVRRLLEAADGVAGILATPPPQAVFEQFGDSALQFRLYVWIDAARGVVQINHDLHMRIDQLFRASGIDIDFPQRDVHLFPAGPFEVRLRTDAP